MSKRHFGSIRKRASGRYQARYTGPDGQTYNAPDTFERKTDAARWLSAKETEITRGDWINPDAGRVAFEDYACQWLADRVLKTRTREPAPQSPAADLRPGPARPPQRGSRPSLAQGTPRYWPAR
jgi:hypothetical protein